MSSQNSLASAGRLVPPCRDVPAQEEEVSLRTLWMWNPAPMPLDYHHLRFAFDQLAHETWDKLERTATSPTRFGEVSITEHNLYALDRLFPELNVQHFNATEEAEVGADWEWWIGADGEGWICLRIQAKRAYGRTYPELKHPGGKSHVFQYDALIAGCDPFQSEFPLHVFYNGWPAGTFRAGTRWAHPGIFRACPTGRGADECAHAMVEEYGCALASSIHVKATHERGARRNRRVAVHISNALPWSYLWHRTGMADPWAEPGAKVKAGDALFGVEEALGRLFAIHGDDATEDEVRFATSLEPDSRRKRQERLPAYAELVRRGSGDQVSPNDVVARAPFTIVADLGPS